MFVLLVLFGLFPILVWESLLGMPGWTTVLKPDFDKWDRVLTYLPGILAGSALNATFEEYLFRVTLLACFIPAVGARQAVGLTAVLFGLEHWPTAGLGVIHAAYYGWVCGKSIVETRGWSWAVVVHIFGDIPIYTLVALSRS
jgi:membrane protease YdiL (CAAX protease family)